MKISAVLCVLVTGGLFGTAYAQSIYNDGGSHTLNGTVAGVQVRDNGTGDPTTLTVAPGAHVTNDLAVYDTSVVRYLGGSTVDDGHYGRGFSDTTIFGGSFGSILDFTYQSTGTIVDATVNCTHQCVRALDDAQVDIFGGYYSGANSNGIYVDDAAQVNLYGGTFAERLRSEHNGLLNVYGGSFDEIWSTSGGTVTIFGSSFDVWTSEGLLYDDWTGTLLHGFDGWVQGRLSDGVVRQFAAKVFQANGRIILTDAQVIPNPPTIPVPAAAWLFGSALFVLGWVRRRSR